MKPGVNSPAALYDSRFSRSYRLTLQHFGYFGTEWKRGVHPQSRILIEELEDV